MKPSNALFAAIIDSSDDAIISKDLNSVITSWNKGAERIFGYKAEEVVGRPITILIPENRADEEPAILDRIRKGQRIDHYETIRKAKDGSLLDISLSVSPIYGEDGRIVGASKIARNITPQRQIQERLRQSEENLRVTLSSIGDAVITTDPEGRVAFMNPVAERLTGWSRKEAEGRPLEAVFRIVNEMTRQPVENPVTKVLRMGTIVGLANHTILIAKDGTERPIDDSGAPIKASDDRGILGVVLVFRDVSEKKAAELVTLRLAAIVESSEDAIISKNLDGIIESWNPAAERVFGYTASDAVGKPITMLIPEERHAEETEIIAKLKAGQRIEHFETLRRTKNGRIIDVSLSISPVRDSSGRVIGASKILRDITQRKDAERKLEKMQQELKVRADDLEKTVQERTASLREMVSELEAFSYSVSHDLRAPLRAIQQYSEILREDYRTQLDQEGRGYLQRIASCTSKLDGLIRDVLAYSRVVRSDIALQPVDIDALVRDLVHHYPNLADHTADIRIESPLLPVQGHEALLVQCFSNLLGNAIKFTHKGRAPAIRVRTDKIGTRVRIWIEDNGIGIEPGDQSRIFGMFERINSEKAYEGTGIGLSIVRKAIERMNGKLGVESELGKGSRFWIEMDQASSEENLPG